MADTQLATTSGFQLANALDDLDPELRSEIEDELSDIDAGGYVSYPTIEVGKEFPEFMFKDEDGNLVRRAEKFEAVIVHLQKTYNYWPDAYGTNSDPEAKTPVCSSNDGVSGRNRLTGQTESCVTCARNQWGSKGDGSNRKACTNSNRLYVILSGDPQIYRLKVTAANIGPLHRQLSKLAGGRGYSGLVVEFSLQKVTKAKTGMECNELRLAQKDKLPNEMLKAVLAMRKELKTSLSRTASYDASDVPDGMSRSANGAVNVDYEELPFDGTGEDIPF